MATDVQGEEANVPFVLRVFSTAMRVLRRGSLASLFALKFRAFCAPRFDPGAESDSGLAGDFGSPRIALFGVDLPEQVLGMKLTVDIFPGNGQAERTT